MKLPDWAVDERLEKFVVGCRNGRRLADMARDLGVANGGRLAAQMQRMRQTVEANPDSELASFQIGRALLAHYDARPSARRHGETAEPEPDVAERALCILGDGGEA